MKTKPSISILRRYGWAISLGLIALAASVYGWSRGYPELGLTEIAFRSLMVFGFNDVYLGLAERPGRWALDLARFLGPASVLIAAASALLDLFGKARIRSAAAKAVPRKALVIGTGPLANSAVEISASSGFRSLHLGAGVLKRSGNVFRLPWEDPAAKTQLIEEYIAGARHVLVAEPVDAENLALGMNIVNAAPGAQVTAIVRNNHLADSFEDLLASGNGGVAHRLRIVSSASLAARHLHVEYPPFMRAKEKDQARIHAVIIGFGDTGEAIARDIAVNCPVAGQGKPKFTVIDPAVSAREASLRQRVPELDETAEFVGRDGAFGCGLQPPPPLTSDEDPITHVYLCLGNDSDTLGAIGAVRQWLRLSGQPAAPIFLRLRSASLAPGAVMAVAFGSTDEIVTLSRWLDDDPDAAAATLHRGYRIGLSEVRKEEHAASTARPWKDLSPDAQRSNRAVLAHVPAKLFSAGLSARFWQGQSGLPSLPHTSGILARLEELAGLEHDRWNAERRWSGWTFAGNTRADGGQKDDECRRHPDLVPFDHLTEESKKYDRDSIRTLESLLTGKDPK